MHPDQGTTIQPSQIARRDRFSAQFQRPENVLRPTWNTPDQVRPLTGDRAVPLRTVVFRVRAGRGQPRMSSVAPVIQSMAWSPSGRRPHE